MVDYLTKLSWHGFVRERLVPNFRKVALKIQTTDPNRKIVHVETRTLTIRLIPLTPAKPLQQMD